MSLPIDVLSTSFDNLSSKKHVKTRKRKGTSYHEKTANWRVENSRPFRMPHAHEGIEEK
jgi:hypothetical protein